MGELSTPEESRMFVRIISYAVVILTLLAVAKFIWTGESQDSCLGGLLGFFGGTLFGMNMAHGWPKEVSAELELTPSLQHEEE